MTEALAFLAGLPGLHDQGRPRGLTSVCSAHPLVIEAALQEAAATGQYALIEATCNQVNQEGGYTGLAPAGFHGFVAQIAARLGFPVERILFGGDHLGPNPWRHLPAEEAMARACLLAKAYAAAGFCKIHLDASMACAGDPSPLPAATIAARAARLAQAAEAGAASRGLTPPVYVIGTEVPVPGGATHALTTLQITDPADAAETLALHQDAFAALNLDAFGRVLGLVVQPGVEFGHTDVIPYQPGLAAPLTAFRAARQGFVYEAHSTDYQSPAALRALVADGFALLKVGPGLTFALREALYALDLIAAALTDYPAQALPRQMEALMLAHPADWQPYCHGSPAEQRLMRHFSYSDRIRYAWTRPEAEAAVARLFAALAERRIPAPLLSQYFPRLTQAASARDLALAAVRLALTPYSRACL